MKKMILAFVVVGAVMMGSGVMNAYADLRNFVWTYQYATVPPGLSEIEYYVTAEVPDKNNGKVNTWKHWLELETGLTRHWDISLYQQFKQSNGAASSSFQYDGFKLRTRYRFGEEGQYILDPLMYLEYKRDDDFSKPDVLEGKVILAKTLGKMMLSYNQIVAQQIGGDGETEHEYAAGAAYEIAPVVSVGFESKGNYTEGKYALGPTLSLVAEKFWVTLGGAFGLNDKTDNVQTRMILGLPF